MSQCKTHAFFNQQANLFSWICSCVAAFFFVIIIIHFSSPSFLYHIIMYHRFRSSRTTSDIFIKYTWFIPLFFAYIFVTVKTLFRWDKFRAGNLLYNFFSLFSLYLVLFIRVDASSSVIHLSSLFVHCTRQAWFFSIMFSALFLLLLSVDFVCKMWKKRHTYTIVSFACSERKTHLWFYSIWAFFKNWLIYIMSYSFF